MDTGWQRRMAACAGMLAVALAGSAFGADEASTQFSTLQKQRQQIISGMIDPKGIQSMTLSPDGKHLAAIEWTGYLHILLLIDTDTGRSRTLVGPEYRSNWSVAIQPMRANWISNALLAVDFNEGSSNVVGFDGRRGQLLGDHFLRMISSDDPAQAPQWAILGSEGFFGSTLIHRVNVFTGESVEVPIGLPGDLIGAVFDRRGHLRAARTRATKFFARGAQVTNWYRHDEQSPWQQLSQAPVTEDQWTPLGVPDDSDTLVVLSREGRDTWAMYRYDVATRRTTELLVGHPTEDLIETRDDGQPELIRAMTHGLKPSTYWFDERWALLQNSVDKVLPDAVNVLRGDPQGMVLVLSYSDREPGLWMVLDTAHMTLRQVGRVQWGIHADTMRPVQAIHYKAADGMDIPAYLTLPDGPAKPRPMVVYIHGGPVARDEWAWDFDVQVLAAAGYAVFQPEFRGSAGFGRRFEEAGYRQWGLAMQDDVTAGVKAMIERGIADPNRICIYGASYGGYAALWGLVKTPELYRCGASLAGVTDIGERFSDWSDTNSSEPGRDWLRFAVGDIDTMAAQFAAVSPEKHAARIHVPVLLGHGQDDRRVPIGHSRRMASALKAAHVSVETHWYENEGHGLRHIPAIFDFEAALLDFLDRNIGPASPSANEGATAAAAASAPASASNARP